MKKVNFKSKKTWIIIGAIVLVVGLLIWFIMKRNKASKLADPAVNPEIEENPNDVPRTEFPLKDGSRNNYVKALQFWIIDNGGTLPKYGMDGVFGAETKAALKQLTGSETVSYEFYIEKIYNYYNK